ncbi:hypothetical protein SGODD07_01229 [Streptococcus gordonii]|uniref:Uncharacterized protein n=1 Tax=Streptococcus gordonii TaxID=1302 RepID=A0A139N665_STRGN|nr:hypothetical protein SGODD07_01229 [Streptococcus gordonii]
MVSWLYLIGSSFLEKRLKGSSLIHFYFYLGSLFKMPYGIGVK